MVIAMQWPHVLADLVAVTPGKQRGVASRIGVQQQVISAWLGCEYWPEGDKVTALASAFGWDSVELAGAIQASKERPESVRPPSPTVARLNVLEGRVTGWEGKLNQLVDEFRASGVLGDSDAVPEHGGRKRSEDRASHR